MTPRAIAEVTGLWPKDGTINVLQVGAKGDGTTDDATAFQSCIEFQTLWQRDDR